MAEITDVKIGQALPGDRWAEAADNLEQAFPIFAKVLQVLNNDGMGIQDAEEFMADAALAVIALRFVAANPETCRFIPIPNQRREDTDQ